MSQPDQIVCPNPKCKHWFDVPQGLEVVKRMKKEGGSFVAFGDVDSKLPCPKCGHPLRVGDIIDGKHDAPKSGFVGGCVEIIGAFFIIGLLIFAVSVLYTKCSR